MSSTEIMPAWVQARYGGVETLSFGSAPVPKPRRGEVLLRVRATALNSADVRILHGEPLLLRGAFGLRAPKQKVRGMDVAATVVALGERVEGVAVGDEVVGELPAGGGLAHDAVAPAARLVTRPAELDPLIAATLPMAGGTAWQALDRGEVTSGSRVLVIGASGGVGTFAVQLAALRGAEVWALCGERSRAAVGALGAARTFDYHSVQPGSPELGASGFDAVIDIAGTAPLKALQGLVRDGGSVVLVSGEGSRLLGPMGRLAAASVRSLGSRRTLRPLAAVAKPDVLRELVALATDGRLTPLIEHTWPLADAGAAMAHLDSGRTVGKVVVTVA